MNDMADPFKLEGKVGFDNYGQLRQAGESYIADGDAQLMVDLGGLEVANSLAVALLVAWHRAAFRVNKILNFSNVSEELRRIIDVCGLDDVLFAK